MALLGRGSDEKSPIEDRLERGRARHRTWQPRWAETLAFFENRQFVWRNSQGTLSQRNVEPDMKEWYRSRLIRNHIFPIVNAEVSAGTARTPGYQVVPSTTDPEDQEAAELSEKVLFYLYELLSLRRKLVNAYRYAVVTGEGFVRPYWNANIGDPVGEGLYEGQVAVEVLGPDAVYWEPGLSFEESPFHGIERAMTREQVKNLPGLKVKLDDLKSDASTQPSFVAGQLSKKSARANALMVTEYLEKPTTANPKGKRVYLTGGKEITKSTDYPCVVEGPEGYEPCLLKMSYVETPWRDRDMGLVEQLVDPQRTLNDCVNKQIEWKNLALNPQLITGPGGLIDPLTNEPGAVFRTQGDPQQAQWRPVPPIPPELQRMKEDALQDMQAISSQNSIPPQIEAGKAIQALLERDQSVRGHIVQNLADFHSKLGRFLLLLVQKYYTEERTIKVQGRVGTEYESFKNADLRDQVDVTVLPGSIEPRTREAVKQELFNLAQLFPGWLTPEKFHAALNGGTAEKLIESYKRDVARAERIIQHIEAGPDNLFNSFAPRMDPTTGEEFPGWMPRPFDNIKVHKAVFEDWFKTPDYERQEQPMQEAAHQYYDALLQLEAEAAQREAELQMQRAEDQGMGNAAKPQMPKPMPSLPSVSNGAGADPNQPPQ